MKKQENSLPNSRLAWLVEKARELLGSRQQAYHHVFLPDSVFTARVLEDLEKFCRGDKTTFHADPRMHALLEGRREVWLRIQDHIKLDLEQLFNKYGRKEQ